MKKIVIFNCPPRSGKDTVAEGLVKFGYKIESFKGKLIEIALLVSDIEKEDWDARYVEQKDVPWDRLGGLSQREYLIKISEEWVKPVHGKQYFGHALAKKIQKLPDDLNVVIPDGGFEEEVFPLVLAYPTNVLILQWGRKGCTFDNDSRRYIENWPHITKRIRDNDTSIKDQIDAVLEAISTEFEKRS